MASALADCRSMRMDSVLMPWRVNQATHGDMITPLAFWMNRMDSSSSSVAAITAPPTVALWPSKYLVVL